MLKLKNIEKIQFDDFVCNHKSKSHFLQSLSWGEFAKAKKNLTPYYLGLVNEKDEIVGATLLLKKSLPMGYSYFYAPRGFVVDYKKKELVRTMSEKVVEFARGKKAIFVKIDPDIIKTSFNYLNEETVNKDFDVIFDTLKSCKFKHQGFTKNFETMQPRYTFRIDLTQDLEDIENHFSKTTKRRINKSEKLDTEVVIGTKDDIEEFYHLMTLTESRKDFISYTKDYYETLYEIFNSNEKSKATLFLGKVVFDKLNYDETDVGNTYTYTISEVNDGKAGYTYDERVHNISVSISDNGDGTLAITATGKDDIVFRNLYNAKGSIVLSLNKMYHNATVLGG